MTTDPGDLVLDPTCGSGTTAHVAEQWGRRWITCDTSRVAIALARTRLMAARFPYYLLADSPEGLRLDAELAGVAVHAFSSPRPVGEGLGERGDIKRGFVYKRVLHITLKSIANNDEIDAIHARYQAQLEVLRAKLNKKAKQSWEEWEIPRQVEGSDDLQSLLQQWWDLRRERQKEIDDSIARHADTELLYDQPCEDNKRIRVTGPFTVESLSPHRVLATDEERPISEAEGKEQAAVGQFEMIIIENLKKAGVQNTIKKERLKFDRLEPFAGTWLHAAGEYTETTSPPMSAKSQIPDRGRTGKRSGVGVTKRALRAEIDEAAWSALYSTKSYPFDPPKTGKIAVKVINHYGDKVLKVYEVDKAVDRQGGR